MGINQKNQIDLAEIPLSAVNKEEKSLPVRQKRRLSEWEEKRVKEMIENGNTGEFIEVLQENGLPPSSQVEMAIHYTRELEESIRQISWTKERLMYTTAILERTLASENPVVTSAENLIRNYLIFSRIFEEKEKKLPRFGQFTYVMRDIFRGVKTKDEVYDRIDRHKTFGERPDWDRKEIENLYGEIEAIRKEVDGKLAEAQKKKEYLDKMMSDARNDEEKRKGTTWSVTYSPPKEYVFPHYTFQTGPLKGQNHAQGRSSWEPMFMAYADVVNKRMEDRIMAREEASEEEKRAAIARHRIELLYEPFDFPVDVRQDDQGKERPVIYRLDFIDINRWRAIEVKGPLTPKGAEKIRLFKKYYIDGDFSGLPEEKKMIMMSYVQNKYSEVAQWCEKKGHPVFDHFSSLNVLGAYKWDHDLNNFNRYASAKDMAGLSERTKEQMQKGFFKLVEERIETGKTPDIRPENYTETDKLTEVIKINQKDANGEKIPYIVNKSISTKPYLPGVVVRDLIENYRSEKDPEHFYEKMESSILDTLPLTQSEKNILIKIDITRHVFSKVGKSLNGAISTLDEEKTKSIIEGKRLGRVPLPVKRELFEKALTGLESFRDYLLNFKNEKTDNQNNQFQPKNVTRYLKFLIDLYRTGYIKEENQYKINKEFLTQTERHDSSVKLSPLLLYYHKFLLGKYEATYDKRYEEIDSMLLAGLFSDSDFDKNIKETIKVLENSNFHHEDATQKIIMNVVFKTFLEEKIPHDLCHALYISNKEIRGFGFRAANAYALINFIEKKFSLEKAASFFAARSKMGITEKEFLNTIKRIGDSRYNTSDLADDQNSLNDFLWDKEKILVEIADMLLSNILGEEARQRLETRLTQNLRKYNINILAYRK